jgi:phosphoglycolate phosphatase
VIFDLDGTLVDSVADVTTVLNAVLGPEGLPAFSADEVRTMIGNGIRALLVKALAARGIAPVPEWLDALHHRFQALYVREHARETKAFPEAEAVLDELSARGIRIGVCTNKSGTPARLILSALGLDRYIDAVVAADDGFGHKPAPEPLLACVAALGVPASSTVYVGDSAIDLETGRAAGIPVVLVSFGYSAIPAVALGSDRTIDTFMALPQAAESLIGD